MILDILENAYLYFPLNERFEKAFDFLIHPGLTDLSAGKYTIDGDHIYAIVARGAGRRKDDALLETHIKYIDIQFIISGTDTMGWRPKSSCKRPSKEYNQETDLQFFADQPDVWLATNPGSFAIFFPEDAHMPLISPGQIHKVVIKVAINQK